MINDLEYYINNLKVLYEDNHIIAIEKPENVLSQKDETNDIDINDIVKEYLKRKYNKPGNVYLGLLHRLDRRVGGVLVLAKTSKAASRLSIDIQNKESFKKEYIAYVNGELDEDGSIDIKIKKDNKRAYVSDDGKDASLDYKSINIYNKNTYVLINLRTGKYNQIRLSFSSIDHPIYGDKKYGAKGEDRIGLWSYKVSFIHPVTKALTVISSLPKGDPWKGLKIK